MIGSQKMIKTAAVEEIIDLIMKKLEITYRRLDLKRGILLFCRLPNGLCFDMEVRDDEVELWHFIGTAPIEDAGTVFEHECLNKPYPTAGLEITNEGILKFYMMHKTDLSRPEDIFALVKGYVRVISDPKFQNIKISEM